MKQEELNAYSVRVTQANRTQLVVITYEIILNSLLSAKEAYQIKDQIVFQKDLKRVQKLLHELMGALDYKFSISFELMSLYQFCGKCIVKSIYQKTIKELDAVERIISRLKSAFEQVANQDKSAPVMENTQAIYAGLTYGKHSLNEVFFDENESNRGFRA